MTERDRPHEPEREEQPPFGGSWGRLYVLVLANLALMVLLFYLFTRAFS